MDIEIQPIQVADLEKFVASEPFQRMAVWPISPRRARSQAQNPRAQPDDVALVLAFSSGELVGYLGALPDVFFLENEEPRRVAWLSCLWVSPANRGQGVAKKLFQTMSAAWQTNLLLTDFSPDGQAAYERSKAWRKSDYIRGIRGYLRPNLAEIMPPKSDFWEKRRTFLKIVDAVLSAPNAVRLAFFQQKTPRFRAVEEVDEQLFSFISERQKTELARRDRAALNWMLKNSWVAENEPPEPRYFFTSTARRFHFSMLELLDLEGKTIGFVAICLRNGHLKVPHAWFDDVQTAAVAALIFEQAIRLRAAMVTVFHPRLVDFFWKNKSPFFAKRAMRRVYFIENGLADFLEKLPAAMQDGDGDGGFT